MRVADNMNFAQVVNNLNKNRKESAELNNQAATMKRITKPSDDPSGTARVLGARTDIDSYKQYEKNVNLAKSFLEFSEQSLGELSEVLVRLKELAVAQSSEAGANAQTRRSIATEVEQLYQQAVQIGNRKMGDRYLFGGFKTTTPPFSATGKYNGDDGELMIEVNKSAFVPMNLPGSKIFLGKGFATRTLIDESDGVPRTPEDIMKLQNHIEKQNEIKESGQKPVEIRGPASLTEAELNRTNEPVEVQSGENLFNVIRALHSGLMSNDTVAVQDTLERFDEAINQVVMARSQLGSRVMTLNNNAESISRSTLDQRTLVSSVEDANAFELFSDINKNETTLKATLETSSRLITPSLLDFLR